MENLYDYVFHFNPFTGFWSAMDRSLQSDYFNGKIKEKDILKNKDINVLVSFIAKGEKITK